MTARRPISLALQGGGAHGAFTWGVLDRLLEAPDLDIVAVSGSSAGALNGAALVAGFAEGGAEGARHALRRLWQEVSEIGDQRMTPWLQSILPAWQLWQRTADVMLPVSATGMVAQVFSPYAWGQQWQNPLATVLERLDFGAIAASRHPRLFVGATNVRSGRMRVFSGESLTAAAVLASACLPTVFQAVEIGGEHYWDGGYTGNPPLWPLLERGLPDDMVIVPINPRRRSDVPKTPVDIQNRISEISFNAGVLSELRAIALARRMMREGEPGLGRIKALRLHLIADDHLMSDLTPSTRLQPGKGLLTRLFAAGRHAASDFLSGPGRMIGQKGSYDPEQILD